MRACLPGVALCAALASAASAQRFMMTHNLAHDFIESGTILCADGGVTTGQNTLWRAFDLSAFELGDVTVQFVEFGIEIFYAPTHEGMTEVTVELFQAPAGSAPAFGLELRGSATAVFEDQRLTIVHMAVDGCIDAGSSLVVAITPQDFGGSSTRSGDRAFLGSNQRGETADSYLSTVDCDYPEPTPYRLLGFPNVSILMNIYGVEGLHCAGVCRADCDGNSELELFDFLCFQEEFAAQTPYADCDENGDFDFFDFLCFQDMFAMGCP